MPSSSYLTVLIADSSDRSTDHEIWHSTWNRVQDLLRSGTLGYTICDGGRFVASFEDDLAAIGSIERIAEEVRRISSDQGKSALIKATFPVGSGNDSRCDVEYGQRASLFVYRSETVWKLSKKRPVVTIGRSPTCDVRLTGPVGLARHALIELAEDGAFLVDNSRSGTLVYHAGGKALLIGGRMKLPGSGVISFPRDDSGGESPDFIAFGAWPENRRGSLRSRRPRAVEHERLRAHAAPGVSDGAMGLNEVPTH